MAVFVKNKLGRRVKKSSPSPLWGHRLPVTALALSARGLDSHQLSREVTASIYDLMGHPGGERERSEAAEQHITRRADLLFQVIMVVVVVDLMIAMVELVVAVVVVVDLMIEIVELVMLTKRVTKNVTTMTEMILK